MSSRLSHDDYTEFLGLLSQAATRRGELTAAIREIFDWLNAKRAAPAETYRSMGLNSGAIAWMEHYERLVDEMRVFGEGPPVDDLLRP